MQDSPWHFGLLRAGVALFTVVIASGCSQTQVNESSSWWFRSDLTPGWQYDYDSKLVITTTIDGKVESHERTSSCTFSVHAKEPKDVNIIKLVKHEDDILSNLMKTFCVSDPPYLRVTPKALCAGEVPILVGPWQEGDRFSFVMVFAVLLSNPVLNASQFRVVEAGPLEAHLIGDVWLISGSKPLKGRCDIWLRNDKDGVSQIRGELRVEHEKGAMNAVLEMGRTAIRKTTDPQNPSQTVATGSGASTSEGL